MFSRRPLIFSFSDLLKDFLNCCIALGGRCGERLTRKTLSEPPAGEDPAVAQAHGAVSSFALNAGNPKPLNKLLINNLNLIRP